MAKLRARARYTVELLKSADQRRDFLKIWIPRVLGNDFYLGDAPKTWLRDEVFADLVLRTTAPQMQHERLWNLHSLVQLANHNPSSGIVLEVGTFRGASAFVLAGATHHTVVCIDSWQGLSSPGPCDGDFWSSGDMRVEMQVAAKQLEGLPNVRLIQGWVPQVFGTMPDLDLAMVHVDVDLYGPTLDTLRWAFPRLRTGGVVVCDDFGFDSCPGARKAMEEFFSSIGTPIIELSTGQAFVIKDGIADG